MSIEEKFDNFKRFVKEVSTNQDTIAQYEKMDWFKLQAIAYTLLLPNRDKLESDILPEMQRRLGFPDYHMPKFRNYIELFVEYLAGESAEKPAEYVTAPEMSFEERMRLFMETQEK